MWELIESLVEYSRIGRKAIRLKMVDLDALIRQCLEEMAGEIQSQEATVEVMGVLGEVEADAALLKIAVHNLVSNGIKYVRPGVKPRVEISTERQGAMACLKFRDNGIGLSAEDQQRIFAPFVRLHGVEDYAGLGLGLSATKRVVEIIGGQIGVASTPDSGSTFWIELTAGGA
jgi:signal transduction histidine kinase